MDNLTKEDRRKNMQNIRSKNTKPERIIMSRLRKKKIYFAKHVKKIFGTPDIVFRRKRVLVFIDSDFWHCNPDNFIMPKTNVEYWKKKFQRNKERDLLVNTKLKNEGWKVIRVWESDIYHDIDKVMEKILTAIEKLDTT
jgi:DNA mismatch endonuclease (patch repair protein)